MIALERAGIDVERYVAYEIDKYAVQISSKNYPDIEHHGNVFEGAFTQYQGFDLLIGGSPCTYWSIAKSNRETTPDGMGGQLFMQYVRTLKESRCRYFLYENNYSIHKNIKAFISDQLGVEPIMINSALVSAQQRRRCYWTNIPNVTQPEDKGILLADVLQNDIPWQDKSCCTQPLRIHEATKRGYVDVHSGECVDLSFLNSKTRRGRHMKDKCNCLTTSNEYFQYLCKKEKTAEPVTKPIRIGQYGKGGQGQRIYSVHGKSITLSALGGGQGAKTGLYKIDLPDGDYIIRKLTPIEAERLQTLPDNYTAGISNTQRYKCIGNGWAVDVIAHILSGLNKNPHTGGNR